MIVLKIILFILLAVLGIILLLLVMPVQVEFSFIGEKVKYKLKYAFINFLDSDGSGLLGSKLKKKKKPEKAKAENSKAEQKESISEEALHAEEEASGTSEQSDESVSMEDDPAQESTGETAANTSSENVQDAQGNEGNSDDSQEKQKKTLGEKIDFIIGIWNSAKRPLRKILKGFHITDIYIDFLVADEDAYDCAIKYGRISTAVYNLLAVFGGLFTTKYKTVDIECGFAQEKSRWDAGCKVYFLPITAVISGIWFLVTYIFRVYLPEKRRKHKAMKTAEKQNTQPQGGM